jgi:hypothetical protein
MIEYLLFHPDTLIGCQICLTEYEDIEKPSEPLLGLIVMSH